MKKLLALGLAVAMLTSLLTGCGNGDTKTNSANDEGSTQSGAICVTSREEGSGTRGAFIELFDIEEKDANGNQIDHTTASAEVTNSTAVMMQTVAGNDAAIGYISLGSLDDSVKAVKIDGAEASVDNVKNGSYKVARPFNIVTGQNLSEAAADFVDFIMSEEGQAIIEDNGYVIQGNDGTFAGGGVSGKVTVAGSSSVTPVMQKLAEAYQAINSNVTIEVQQSDSTTGVTSTIEGVCDIGMASRELSNEETSQGVSATVIAMDGIAVIVNNNNAMEDLTSDQVKAIFTGETTDWSEVQ